MGSLVVALADEELRGCGEPPGPGRSQARTQRVELREWQMGRRRNSQPPYFSLLQVVFKRVILYQA